MAQPALPNINIEYYLDLAVRRKWWIIVPALLSILAGVIYIMITPKAYKANTLILVQPQKVPASYVTSTITVSLESRLRTITQQVYSRTNLENVIDQFDLYADDREETPMLELIEDLRKKIKVNLRGGGASQSFEISFQWNDPKTAAMVTNSMASQFIEQNLKVREDMAMGTTAFLENETAKMRRELEAQEKRVELYKKEHMGMLPDQLESNLKILGQLKVELNNLAMRAQAEKEQYTMLQGIQVQLKNQTQMLQMEHMQSSDFIESAPDVWGETQSEEISYLEAHLRQLLLRYTEKHPDVVSLKRKIARLQQENDTTASEIETESPSQFENPLVSQEEQIRFQLQDINRRVESYQKQISRIKKEIQSYNERIERTPEVQLELTKLTRDYSTMQRRYQSLLQKHIDARMAEQLERRQKGEQFKVLDPAVVPEKPFRPNVMKVMLMALIMGLGFGCGLAFLRDIMLGTFYNTEDLEGFLGSKVLVSIPLVKGNV